MDPTEIAQQDTLLPIGLLTLDTHGRIQAANQTAAELLCYSAEDLVGIPAHETLHAAHLDGTPLEPLHCPLCGTALSGGRIQSWEGLLHRSDDRPLQVIASATATARGAPHKAAGVITFQPTPAKQDELEERLLRRERDLAEVQRLAQLGNWSWEIAEDRLFCSSQVYRILGLAPAQAGELGSRAAFMARVHPEDRSFVQQALEGAKRGGGYTGIEYRILRPEGELRWVRERTWCELSDAELPRRMAGALQDVTEEREREEALQISERRLREMAESIDEVFWSRTVDGSIDFVNAAYEKIWGYSRASLYEHPESFLDAVHPEDYEKVRQARLTAYTTPFENLALRFRIIRPDESERWVECRRYPLTDAQGQVTRLVGTIRDITDYMEAQRRLEEANQAKTELLNTVNHDLRTPLNAVLGFLEVLEQGDLAPTHRTYVHLCRSAAQRMLELVNTWTELSHLDSGRTQLSPEPLSLRPFLEGHRAQLAALAAKKGVALQWEIDEQLPEQVQADPVRLAQVLVNLTENAIKFTEEGTVRVRLQRAQGDQAHLSVEDTGPGIDAAEQERIFQPFEQGKGARLGTGLGLSICKRLVQLMGGELWVVSEPGQGTTFHATLHLPPSA